MGLLIWLGLRRPNIWERLTLLDHLLHSPLQWLVTLLYHLILLLRGRPFVPPPNKPPIRVVCISDTHDRTLPVPDGDLLIHCGDLTNDGTVSCIQKQLDWLASLPHTHKVFICGNHDSWFDERARRPDDRAAAARKPDFRGMHYLQDRAVTLEFKAGRRLNVYGSPWLPACGGPENAFQYPRDQPPWEGKIPDETDVLVTHTPPRHHLDLSLGCPSLLAELWRVKPRLHVFGHVHCARGREPVFYDECQRAYESLMDAADAPSWCCCLPVKLFGPALRVLRHGVACVLWKWLMVGPGPNHGAVLVNAAVARGNTGRVGGPVEVVEL